MNGVEAEHSDHHLDPAGHNQTQEETLSNDQRPYAELRVGDLHLTLQRRPARLLFALGALALGFGGWLIGNGGAMPFL